MFSPWNLLYLIPLCFVAYKAFKKNKVDYKKITSALLIGFGLVWLASFILKSGLTRFSEADNHVFAFVVDMLIVSFLIRFVGFKIIVGLLLIGYGAMIYYAYIPFVGGKITLHQYYINLEIIGFIQVLLINGGMFYGQLITGIDSLLRWSSRGRLNVPSYFCVDDNDLLVCSSGSGSGVGKDCMDKPQRDMEIFPSHHRKENRLKPTYGTGPNDYWKAPE